VKLGMEVMEFSLRGIESCINRTNPYPHRAVNLEDFGNKPLTGPASHLKDAMEGNGLRGGSMTGKNKKWNRGLDSPLVRMRPCGLLRKATKPLRS
jgi:hypothetical protein